MSQEVVRAQKKDYIRVLRLINYFECLSLLIRNLIDFRC